jgi:hypothetical protein
MSEGMKGMVGQKMTKKVKFMGKDLEISKLSVSEVLQIQDLAKQSKEGEDERDGFAVLRTVIQLSAQGAKDLSDEEFDELPLDELSTLSDHIMAFSGIGDKKGK